MRFLVTGGFGFIGGRLAQYLAAKGHQVILGSRSADKAPPLWLPEAKVGVTSWNDTGSLGKLCDKVDVVVHAAGMNAQECAYNPPAAFEFNGAVTARLFEVAKNSDVQRFVYLSTAHVYANPLVGRIDESMCPRNLHPYATSHLAGEHAVLNSINNSCIQGIVLRLSNVFGAPAHKAVNSWRLLVNDLCRQAVEYGVMCLHSNGLQQRDFVPMTDVCSAVSILTSCPGEQVNGQAFNIGSGKSRLVIDMAKLVQSRCQEILGFLPELKFACQEQEDQILMELKYQIEKCSAIGVSMTHDFVPEIDSLLLFCSQAFSKKSCE